MASPKHFWFISLPATPDQASARSTLGSTLAENAGVYPLHFPEFKIGTLDTLMLVSEDLQRQDQIAEGLVTKLVDTLSGLLVESGQSVRGISQVLTVHNDSVDAFIKKFQWNTAKYRPDRPVRELLDAIAAQVHQTDSATRNRIQQFNQVKSGIQNVERKNAGNLAVRSLTGLITKEMVVPESEFLQTLFIAVPKNLEKHWWNNYERMTPMIVPRSSQKIAEDTEFLLVNVTVFKKAMEEFSAKCRDERFVIREFSFEEGRADRDEQELKELMATRESMRSQLIEWTRTNFEEAFSDWVHFKALRVYVESVLRYGLPPDFVFAAVIPKKGQDKRCLQKLELQYSHLGRSFSTGKSSNDVSEDLGSLSLVDKEYKPFVWFELLWDVDSRDR